MSPGNVLVAAGGVALTGRGWPDIVVGGVIALWFLKSAFGVVGGACCQDRTRRAAVVGQGNDGREQA